MSKPSSKLTAKPSAKLTAPAKAKQPPARSLAGLRPVDKELTALRKLSDVAPHSAALSHAQSRNKDSSGYAGQSTAHEAMSDLLPGFAAQATQAHPLAPLEASAHMLAAHLHATLPGPDLYSGISKGFPRFNTGNLSNATNRAEFADHVHERREQVKANFFELAEFLPSTSRQRIAMPSPPRGRMPANGGYIKLTKHESKRRLDFDMIDGPYPLPSEAKQRQLARDAMRPLSEPLWTAKKRKVDEISNTPWHNSNVNEVEKLFRQQPNHSPAIGEEASRQYKKRKVPSKEEVRVEAVHSAPFYESATKDKFGKPVVSSKAGLHEVVPTENHMVIAKLPDNARMAIAHAQADIRTNTSLTIFRGKKLVAKRKKKG